MNKYENEMTFTVVSYDKQTGYHGCIDSNGKTHQIDLCVAAVFDESDDWFIGKTFVGEVKPNNWIAYRFEVLKSSEGQESAFRKVIEALNSEDAETAIPIAGYQFGIEKSHGSAKQWSAWLQENKEKIMKGSE